MIIDGQEPGHSQLERVTPTTERTPTAHEESEGRETAWKVNIGLNSPERSYLTDSSLWLSRHVMYLEGLPRSLILEHTESYFTAL